MARRKGAGKWAREEHNLLRRLFLYTKLNMDDDVIRDAAGKITAYEVEWPSNGDSNRIARGNVRAPVAGTEEG